MAPETVEHHGLYLRSSKHGVYVNVRTQGAEPHPPTRDGLLALLRDQSWASAPFDEWVITSGPLTIVGGTFETTGMDGLVRQDLACWGIVGIASCLDGRYPGDISGAFAGLRAGFAWAFGRARE